VARETEAGWLLLGGCVPGGSARCIGSGLGATNPPRTGSAATSILLSPTAPNVRQTRWSRPSTTPHSEHVTTSFQVTHPHHPLRGQKFRLVTYRHNWGEDRVFFHDAEGRLSSIPACWTTVVAEDPFVAVAAGRCFFRYQDLLKLVEWVEKLGRGDGPAA
jgi:hypothetical protein